MTLAIKRRTIGVIILLIIFAWIGVILHRQHLKTVVPNELLAPNPPKVPMNVSDELGTLQNQLSTVESQPSPIVQPSSKINAPVGETQPPLTSVKLPLAWVVQLATFSNKQNAAKLLLKIRNQGYDAYSRNITVNKKRLTKVFVGPNISYRGIKKIQQELETRYHLHGVIQSYHLN